jgi:DNA polymerase III delta subunit
MIQYVFGDDTFTARKNIHEQAEALHATIRWVDKEDSESSSIEELFDSAKGSLLGNMFVVLQDPSSYSEEVRDRILATCEGTYSGNVLLWDRSVDKRLTFYKKIKALVPSKEMAAPADEEAMAKWATTYAPDIPLPAMYELISRVGCDVWSVANEIDKLRVLDSPVEATHVQEVVAQRDTSYSSAFPLLDAIVRKQKVSAVAQLNELLDGGASERFVLAMLAYQFRLFLGIKMGQASGESVSGIQKKTGLHPVSIQKGMAVASRLSVDVISDVLNRIAATEKSLVTTTMDPRSIVTMLVIGLCR